MCFQFDYLFDDISYTSFHILDGVICFDDSVHTWVQALLHFKFWQLEPVIDQFS